MPDSRNVVVLRCGSVDVAERWIAMMRASDSWSLVILFYRSEPFGAITNSLKTYSKKDIFCELIFGGKWTAIAQYLQQGSITFEYFFFPDDDILISQKDVDRLFLEMSSGGYDVGQPALTPDSYFSHLLTLAHKHCKFRVVNLVEVMMPVLSGRLVDKMLPLFMNSESGFGLDYAWSIAAAQSGNQYGGVIFDDITAEHTRPVGSELLSELERMGKPSAADEWRHLNDTIGASGRQIPLNREMHLHSGVVIRNRLAKALVIFFSLRRLRPKGGLLPYKQDLWRYIKRCLLRSSALSPLSYFKDSEEVKSD